MVTPGIVVLNGVNYLCVNDDSGSANSAGLRGSERKQDLTPSTRDQVEGVPGDTDIPTGSIVVYGDAGGSWGLSDRILAPGDNSRPFLTELDNTRARQLTAWIGSSSNTAVSGGNFGAVDGFVAVVDAAGGYGVVCLSAAATYDFYQWNGSAFAKARAGYTRPSLAILSGYTSRGAYGTFRAPPQVVRDYAGGLWMAVDSGGGSRGLVNLAVAAVGPVGDATSVGTVAYLDMLWSFGIAASGITITPYRFSSGQTPATAIGTAADARVQKIDTYVGSSTYGTTVASTVTISGEYAVLGAIASESNVFLVTDRSVYRIGWTDGPNVFDFTRLPVDVPAFTGAPVAWNGEVWIPAGNQIVHIVPGQRTYDTVLIDDIGNMPSPFSGRCIQLMPSYSHLCAMLIDDLTSTPTNTVLGIRDTNGAWHTRAYTTSNQTTATFPMLQKLDASGFALALRVDTGNTHQYPVLAAGKNPKNLSVSLRTQEGTQRIIFPWEVGQNEASLKQLLRARLQVTGVGAASAATHVRAYFEADLDSEQGDSVTVSGASGTAVYAGIANGTGAWQLAADAYRSAIGDYSSAISGSGNGYIWTEFDGSSAVAYVATVAGALPTGSLPPTTTGSGFTSTPSVVAYVPPGSSLGTGLVATATLNGSAVGTFNVSNGGSGWPANVFLVANGGKSGGGSGSSFSRSYLNPASYPTFRRIRWMVETGGDTAGTLVPAAVALLWEYYEYPKVQYQFVTRLQFRANDTHSGISYTPAQIVAALDALEALKNNRTIYTYTGLDQHSWSVLETKISRDIISMDSGGIDQAEVDVTLTVVPLQGTV